MKFKYKMTISDQILQEKTNALMEGREIEEVFLTPTELALLDKEVGRHSWGPRDVGILGGHLFGIKISLE